MRVKVGVAETTGFGFFPDAVTVGGGAAAATLPAPDGCWASGGLDVPPSRHAASPATAAPTTRMETSATSTVRWRCRGVVADACGTSVGSSSWRATRALYSSM